MIASIDIYLFISKCNIKKLIIYQQDFESNVELKIMTIAFLDDILGTPTLLPSEHRASSQLLRMLTKDDPTQSKTNLEQLLSPVKVSKNPVFNISYINSGPVLSSQKFCSVNFNVVAISDLWVITGISRKMSLRQVELDISSFFAKFLAYLMIFQKIWSNFT